MSPTYFQLAFNQYSFFFFHVPLTAKNKPIARRDLWLVWKMEQIVQREFLNNCRLFKCLDEVFFSLNGVCLLMRHLRRVSTLRLNDFSVLIDGPHKDSLVNNDESVKNKHLIQFLLF